MEKIKLVIFDLDGVLVEAKNIHYDALNQALGKDYSIDWNEHLSVYDGLKTNQKLEMLTERKGLPTELHSKIWENKQKYTLQMLKELQSDETLQSVMNSLVECGYKVAVCSNSIRKTVLTVLSKLGIMEFMDLVIWNDEHDEREYIEDQDEYEPLEGYLIRKFNELVEVLNLIMFESPSEEMKINKEVVKISNETAKIKKLKK